MKTALFLDDRPSYLGELAPELARRGLRARAVPGDARWIAAAAGEEVEAVLVRSEASQVRGKGSGEPALAICDLLRGAYPAKRMAVLVLTGSADMLTLLRHRAGPTRADGYIRLPSDVEAIASTVGQFVASPWMQLNGPALPSAATVTPVPLSAPRLAALAFPDDPLTTLDKAGANDLARSVSAWRYSLRAWLEAGRSETYALVELLYPALEEGAWRRFEGGPQGFPAIGSAEPMWGRPSPVLEFLTWRARVLAYVDSGRLDEACAREARLLLTPFEDEAPGHRCDACLGAADHRACPVRAALDAPRSEDRTPRFPDLRGGVADLVDPGKALRLLDALLAWRDAFRAWLPYAPRVSSRLAENVLALTEAHEEGARHKGSSAYDLGTFPVVTRRPEFAVEEVFAVLGWRRSVCSYLEDIWDVFNSPFDTEECARVEEAFMPRDFASGTYCSRCFGRFPAIELTPNEHLFRCRLRKGREVRGGADAPSG